jgi:hypothetical protein
MMANGKATHLFWENSGNLIGYFFQKAHTLLEYKIASALTTKQMCVHIVQRDVLEAE